MPSSGPESWDRLYEDLSRHEQDRESLGYPKDLPTRTDADVSRIADLPSIPRYEILDRLGEGATSVVYRAMDRELHRPVALKVQRQSLAPNDVLGQRFRREAQAAAGVSHPNVVMIHDAGEERGRLYLVMELVDGRPLSEVLRDGARDPKDLLRILEKAARGVAAAHEKGIVHRDLKPSNILVTGTGEPKVADFGLAHLVDSTAQLTKTGSSLGTPLYMSPEQVEGRSKDITPRTDVYSLGAILYELVTGRVPHDGETMMEIYRRIVHEEPAAPRMLNPQASEEIETVALKALEKDPERRYPTAKEFGEDLARYLAGEPVLARPLGWTYRAYRALRRSSVARGLAIGLAVALLAAGALGVAVREKSARLVEREKRVSALRDKVRISLSAVLVARRGGENEEMKTFIPGLEAAYREALEVAPDVAEVEYLMGRMYRALMEEEKALDYQKRALEKDPVYAPALYERAVLLANRYGSELTKAVADARRLPPGPVTVQPPKSVRLPDPSDVEVGRQDLVAIKETILQDCTVLDGILAREPGPGRSRPVSDASVLTVKGILAFCRLEFPEARRLLEEAVRKDPTLEEAWVALCETVYRQGNIRGRESMNVDEVVGIYDEADRLYEKAISHDKGFVPHWYGRADNSRHRGVYLMSRGKNGLPDLKKADAELEQAWKLNPDRAETLILRVSVRQMTAVLRMDRAESPVKELEAAEADLKVLQSRWPARAVIWSLVGQLHNQRARWRRGSAGDPMPEYEEAEKAFGQAMKLDPQGMDALMDRGMTRLYRALSKTPRGMDPLPDFAAAEADLSEALHFVHHTARAWESRGQVLYHRGLYRLSRNQDGFEDISRAIGDFSASMKISLSGRTSGSRARAQLTLAGLLEKKGELEEAVQLLTDAGDSLRTAIELNKSLEAEFAGDAADIKKRLAKLAPK
jgi:serine/threonine-protein kinase